MNPNIGEMRVNHQLGMPEIWTGEKWVIAAAINPKATDMSLRDYFASQVIAGMASLDPQTLWNTFNDKPTSLAKSMAETAYKMADAMMEQRQ